MPPSLLAPRPEHTAEAEDFPIGWELKKGSWHFHRRFYGVFRRPMHRGEYSYLIHQIRHGRAEHLSDDCWRVTLPGGTRTLPVRATPWRLRATAKGDGFGPHSMHGQFSVAQRTRTWNVR